MDVFMQACRKRLIIQYNHDCHQDNEDICGPVSYTHLDVYKRQAKYTVNVSKK